MGTAASPEQRGDVVNATLLAQLVAKQRVPEPKTLPGLISWYEHYFDVLSRVGFAIQDRGFMRLSGDQPRRTGGGDAQSTALAI